MDNILFDSAECETVNVKEELIGKEKPLMTSSLTYPQEYYHDVMALLFHYTLKS